MTYFVHSGPRKSSPTQPGRGIRKIVDLYHDLTDLLYKARLHAAIDALRANPSPENRKKIEDMERRNFAGMAEEEIEEEWKEYVLL